jgi:hypothetical protein
MNRERLVKILKLASSPEDAEALASIRKATELLKRENYTWEGLILYSEENERNKKRLLDLTYLCERLQGQNLSLRMELESLKKKQFTPIFEEDEFFNEEDFHNRVENSKFRTLWEQILSKQEKTKTEAWLVNMVRAYTENGRLSPKQWKIFRSNYDRLMGESI